MLDNFRPKNFEELMTAPPAQELLCKVCERGGLESKNVFRMSGPAVAIGYILLVPSIIGILICAVLIIVALIHGSSPSASGNVPVQENVDGGTRRWCINSLAPPNLSDQQAAQYCECWSSLLDHDYIGRDAIVKCMDQLSQGTIAAIDPETLSQYSSLRGHPQAYPQAPQKDAPLGISENLWWYGVTVIVGICFFVSGLLGWLLVMKKKILQCSICGATISAS
jgi:hypothetical protein